MGRKVRLFEEEDVDEEEREGGEKGGRQARERSAFRLSSSRRPSRVELEGRKSGADVRAALGSLEESRRE